MASINKIQPGQTLYDVKRNTGLRAFASKLSVWPVEVVSVHLEENYIVAKWNGNPARKMYHNSIKALKVKEPK